MKVEEKREAASPPPKQPDRRFGDLLRESRGEPLQRPLPAARPPPNTRAIGVKNTDATPVKQLVIAQERTARSLKEARAHHDASAEGLTVKADEHRGHTQQSVEDRVLDKIVREVERGPKTEL